MKGLKDEGVKLTLECCENCPLVLYGCNVYKRDCNTKPHNYFREKTDVSKIKTMKCGKKYRVVLF